MAGGVQTAHLDEGYDGDGVMGLDIDDRSAFGVRVRGDSMTPRIQEGDAAIVTPSKAPRNGSVVLARLIDGDVILKLYQAKDSGRLVVLSSYNPAYPPIEVSREELAWVYPVAQVIQTLS